MISRLFQKPQLPCGFQQGTDFPGVQFFGQRLREIQGLDGDGVTAQQGRLGRAARFDFHRDEIEVTRKWHSVRFSTGTAVVTDQIPDASPIEVAEPGNEVIELDTGGVSVVACPANPLIRRIHVDDVVAADGREYLPEIL